MTEPVYVADMENCRTVELEGLTLLFHPRSGMTHILAPPSPQILEALAHTPGDSASVLSRLRERFDLADDEAAGAVAARLAELEASGLVRRA